MLRSNKISIVLEYCNSILVTSFTVNPVKGSMPVKRYFTEQNHAHKEFIFNCLSSSFRRKFNKILTIYPFQHNFNLLFALYKEVLHSMNCNIQRSVLCKELTLDNMSWEHPVSLDKRPATRLKPWQNQELLVQLLNKGMFADRNHVRYTSI